MPRVNAGLFIQKDFDCVVGTTGRSASRRDVIRSGYPMVYIRFFTSARTCQRPPGTTRIPPPQLSAKRVPNLNPPVSGAVRKSETARLRP